jgi:hypothetical protein
MALPLKRSRLSRILRTLIEDSAKGQSVGGPRRIGVFCNSGDVNGKGGRYLNMKLLAKALKPRPRDVARPDGAALMRQTHHGSDRGAEPARKSFGKASSIYVIGACGLRKALTFLFVASLSTVRDGQASGLFTRRKKSATTDKALQLGLVRAAIRGSSTRRRRAKGPTALKCKSRALS